MASRIVGTWRIVEMDLWDRKAIDLVGPAFIKFNADGTGDFRYIAVEGYLDCRDAKRREPPRVDFMWGGNDEGDHASPGLGPAGDRWLTTGPHLLPRWR
jgi:hypothetical protein